MARLAARNEKDTYIQDFTLLGIALCQRGIHTPTALVIQDIRADFPNLFRSARKIQPIVLDLEVLSQREQDGLCLVVQFRAGQSDDVHG